MSNFAMIITMMKAGMTSKQPAHLPHLPNSLLAQPNNIISLKKEFCLR